MTIPGVLNKIVNEYKSYSSPEKIFIFLMMACSFAITGEAAITRATANSVFLSAYTVKFFSICLACECPTQLRHCRLLQSVPTTPWVCKDARLKHFAWLYYKYLLSLLPLKHHGSPVYPIPLERYIYHFYCSSNFGQSSTQRSIFREQSIYMVYFLEWGDWGQL